MITLRKSAERGTTRIGWLDSRHSFSFGDYLDPRHMHFGPLRVINEDIVAPGAGFPPHPHRDMEIFTWVLEGGLAHKDSTGSAEVLRPGEAQRMTAGTGIRHSEYNASATDPVHFLQIWIVPRQGGLTPGYEQKSFAAELDGRLRVIASPDGRDGSVTIAQDAAILAGRLRAGEIVTHRPAPGHVAWLQVARGAVTVNGIALAQGDGAAIQDETALELIAANDAEVLLFDMVS